MALYVKPFTQIVEDTQHEMNEYATTSADSTLKNKYRRRVNLIYQRDLPTRFEWEFLRKTGSITLSASYSTGTVDIAVGDTAITGTSTVWTSSHTGMKIKISGSDEIYTFTRTAATTGTISPAYAAIDDADDASYTIFQDVYSLASDFDRAVIDEGIYQFFTGVPKYLKWEGDKKFLEMHTYQPSDYPRRWRIYPGLSSASLYQIQVSPPPQRAFIIHNEYIQSLDEMVDRTDTAATGSTTIKLLTTTNMNGLIDVGDYVRVDADE